MNVPRYLPPRMDAKGRIILPATCEELGRLVLTVKNDARVFPAADLNVSTNDAHHLVRTSCLRLPRQFSFRSLRSR